MTYSIIPTLKELGINVENQNQLCGLAEYRNGGLILDSQLVELKDQSVYSQILPQDSEVIVEWRALTIACLDKIVERVRGILGVNDNQLTMAQVLEGGTWAAGRRIAKEKRGNQLPPLSIKTDGTLF